ncbi:competence/damage-inducible protein A [Labilibacter sediminis]|nr:competence/damage-inducible protein A [Labilibacter sediminis]
MKIEIVTIGDELLIGQVVDTNSAWIGKQFNNSGFEINRITSVKDTEAEILNILKETSRRADVVLLTGGLGPTKDDITKVTMCKFFGAKLVFNDEVFEDIKILLKDRVSSINELNKQQAMVPDNCTVIRNPVGTAPVMWFEHGGTIFVSMPGVPSEMKHAVEGNILPRLISRFKSSEIIHKTVLIHNIPEAVLAEMLEFWENALPEFISVAYLPSPGRIRLRLTAKGQNKRELESSLQKVIDQLYPIVGEAILGYDDVSTVKIIFDLFIKNKLTLATAESCTGGNIAHQITLIPGSSNIFKGSVVAYHNHIKTGMLGVDERTLEKNGAVSKEVVEQMALGAKKSLKSDYAMATSGIAGPGGGSELKPVGTVWIAVAGPNGVISNQFKFGHIRERNIIRSTEKALVMLKHMVEKDLV